MSRYVREMSTVVKPQPLYREYSSRYLPMLRSVSEYYSDWDLSKTLVIAVQHLCSTTEALFVEFFERGLAPQNLMVLGKCYSTNPETVVKLKSLGVNISRYSSYFNPSYSYDDDFETFVGLLLEEGLNRDDFDDFEQVLLIDDGGHLLDLANQLIPSNKKVVAVEQTSSGFNRLKQKSFFFPIVNMSRSWVKLKYETPLILDLVLKQLNKKIQHAHIPIRNILVIGAGTLGSALCQKLRYYYSVDKFDKDPDISSFHPNEFKNRLKSYDLIIGCTGYTSLPSNYHAFLKRPSILASISSSDREFDATSIRSNLQDIHCHSDCVINKITLMNAGFPISFVPDYDEIDTDDFQLTRSLIYVACYQAVHTQTSLFGFIDLNDTISNHLEKLWLSF